MKITLVTGTNTDVGKTIATAALVVRLQEQGKSVAVMKPAQTGEPEGSGDLATIHKLTGLDHLYECARFPEPLAPDVSAQRAGVSLLDFDDVVERIVGLEGKYEHLLIEGAGGLLVRLGAQQQPKRLWTLADLGAELHSRGYDTEFLIVTSTNLGSLNSAELTVEALRHRDLPCAGLIAGSHPTHAGLAEQLNLTDLPRVTDLPLLAVIPEGSGKLSTAEFRHASQQWFS
ncbi:ATP-dependent dethiobiotin synthetase BioD [Corynebacterium sp. 3HC-13]|nr:dethiobiotin synthase [Corynebacterium poyangense]MBZ8177248.1 ATP-dependent dethiobiotin synthetase BioD [Corynebacterium poyangense]